jgi:membrane peptidoglycan carboxypeptidase
MHPAMQRRRHRLMVRRTTRGHAPRRGILVFLAVSFGVFAMLIAGSVAATAGGLFAAYNYYSSGLPDPHLLDGIDLPASTYVYDRTGKTLLARFECQNREQVSFRELPDDVVNATVAIEDRTFWTNDGIDYTAVARAALANLEAGGTVQGASTITAQVIKYAGSIKEAEQGTQSASAAPSPLEPADAQADPEVCAPPNLTFLAGRTYEDKIREFILAREMTAAYPGRSGKEKILETYMNLVFYGNGSYGIKAAAANYFGISDLSQLTLSQSAFLAGLSQLPSVYDPYYNNNGPDRAIARRNDVLDAMLRDGYITQRQATQAKAVTWKEMNPRRITSVFREPLFSFRVQREAESILAAQGVANPAEAVRTGGYRIITTLDFQLQQTATADVTYWVNCLQGVQLERPPDTKPKACNDFNVHNGALIAIDSSTGEIVAYVGSVDYLNREDKRVQGQWDIAGVDLRQPGSAFKPITYSAAFQAREATPATFFVDSVIQYGSKDPTQAYIPSNADLKDHGPLLALDGLHFSLNVPSVQMQYLVGESATAAFAEKMGIASADYINGRDPGLTLTLGSVEVNPTKMTSAYGVFADEGTLHPATTIREIRDRNGRLIYNIADDGPQATHPMTPAEAYLTNWIIQGNTDPRINPIWGRNAQLVDPSGAHREAGFKTGTTNDFRDVSAFGYVPGGLVTGVWMGNTNRDPLSNRVYGGLLSADGPMFLWQQFMTQALNNPWDWNDQAPSPNTKFDQPDGVVTASVCRYSGMRATSDCGPTITVPFLDGTVPPPDNVHADGCFDIVKEVQQDSRRSAEFVAAAERWADRYVNNELSSKGSPGQIGVLGPEKVWLAITPIPGSPFYPGTICGEVRPTPTPTPGESVEGSPGGSGGPFPSCNGNPRKCSPAPTIIQAPAGAAPTSLDAAALVPLFAGSTLLALLSLAARGTRRLRRR